MFCRVVCGNDVTMDICSCNTVFNSVDFPLFGRPNRAMKADLNFLSIAGSIHHPDK
jgi:hypothetical protein